MVVKVYDGHLQAAKTLTFRLRFLVYALLIFPGRPTDRPAVRKCPVDTCRQKKAPTFQSRLLVFALLGFPGRPTDRHGVGTVQWTVTTVI